MPFAPVESDDDKNLARYPPNRRKRNMLRTGEQPRRGLEHPTFTVGG